MTSTTALAAEPPEPERPNDPDPAATRVEQQLGELVEQRRKILGEQRRSALEPVAAALAGMTTELRRVADALQPTPVCGAGSAAPNALGDERCTLDAGHPGRHGDGLTSWPREADEEEAADAASPHPYPYQDGDVVVLGPEIFVSMDGEVICWKGRNYTPAPTPAADGGPVRCPLCLHTVTLHTSSGARAHFTTVHPEYRLIGPGPWPLLATGEQPTPDDEPPQLVADEEPPTAG
ncbi:MAG: hypothetical protein ACRDXB_03545, partial [Actinomycetes bacterium]